MAIFDDGIKAFLEAYTYFVKTLGKGREKLAKELAEEATGVKAPEKLEPVIPGNEVIRIPSKVEKGELMSINSTFSNPLKSDFVLSKIDGTAGSKYSVLRAETEQMFPRFTEDLKYIKDNNIALTTVQKNNIINNLRLKRSLQSDIKRLEIDLVRDDKNPRMIYEAYITASKKPSSESILGRAEKLKELSEGLSDMEIKRKNLYRPKDDQLPTKEESLAEGQEMFKGFKPKVIEGGKGKATPVDDGTKGIDDLFDKDGVLNKDAVLSDITETLKSRVPKKAGQGRFTKAQVLIARLENTLKTSKDPYVLENFPNFIKEIKAKPELANDPGVFDSLGGPLSKNQKFVEYDDGTIDFFQKTDFGPQNIAPAQKLAEELGISTKEASAILKMEPEDQVLEIGRRKALANRIDNLVDDTLSEEPTSLYDENFDDYFDPDDKPNQAKGGIISLT